MIRARRAAVSRDQRQTRRSPRIHRNRHGVGGRRIVHTAELGEACDDSPGAAIYESARHRTKVPQYLRPHPDLVIESHRYRQRQPGRRSAMARTSTVLAFRSPMC